MIESNNPEINAAELMAKVQAEVERRKAAGILPPALQVRRDSVSEMIEAEIRGAIHQARQKHKVDVRIPKPVHLLFRDQGGVNVKLLRVVELLATQVAALRAAQERLEKEIAACRSDNSRPRQAAMEPREPCAGEGVSSEDMEARRSRVES